MAVTVFIRQVRQKMPLWFKITGVVTPFIAFYFGNQIDLKWKDECDVFTDKSWLYRPNPPFDLDK